MRSVRWAILGLCVAAAPALGADFGDRAWVFAGKLHPLVVHFPIALLVAGCVAEFLRFRRRRAAEGWRPGRAGMFCVGLGACGAAAAAVMGWSDAQTAGHHGAVLETHRWLGVSVAAVAAAALVAAVVAMVFPGPRRLNLYRTLCAASAVVVAVAGHWGGRLVYGDGYLGGALATLWGGGEGAANTPTVVAVSGGGPSGEAAGRGAVEFERDILPILSRRCYPCHTGDQAESGLRLDRRESALEGGDSGKPAIVPGSRGESRLYQLVSAPQGAKLVMPPKGGRLPDDEVALIGAWIDAGAAWKERAAGEHWHWAYRKPVRPNLPEVKDTWWARNAIDPFVLAKLEAQGLKPSPEADKATLLRRVSLDLIGLPPTPAELDAFLADTSDDAYERVVDRLLDSPRFGERWARVWLDLARYADTNGYEKDNRRVMWPYRDWVIDAFNADMPFDRFTIEQLAGDLLPSPTVSDLVATGFHRNTMVNEEGGVDREEFRVDSVVDRVNTTAAVWLGTTLACCQCHDHKFDPLPQKDYYRFFAIFNNCETDVAPISTGSIAAGAMVTVPVRGKEGRFAEVEKEIAGLKTKVATQTPELERAQAAWEARVIAGMEKWTALKPARVASTNGATLSVADSGLVTASGQNPDTDVYTVEAEIGDGTVTAVRLDVLTDEGDPNSKVGRATHGNIVVADFDVFAQRSGEAQREVAVEDAAADFEQHNDFGAGGEWPVVNALDEDPRTGWAIGPETGKPHTAVFQLKEPVKGPAKLAIRIGQTYGGMHTIGRFRLSVTGMTWEDAAATATPHALAIIRTPVAERTPEEKADLSDDFRTTCDELEPAREQLKALRKERSGLVAASALVLRERKEPRETRVMERGNFLAPGEKVEPGVPMVFKQLPADGPADRMALAKWLVDPENPLTARVTVNRIWEQFFGRGIVETSEDFGTQGDPPTHPELLDYLATELVRDRWSMKAAMRLIVTSATYRQSSAVSPELLEKDPTNKLLARGPRFRVEAEMIRDVALSASGLLSGKIGGPSVFPPQPEGVWTMIYNDDTWVASQGEDRYRRGLYTFWRRTAPYPTFVAFDATSREKACTRRARTNTPLQALTTLNDPQFVEAAQALARRAVREAGPDAGARVAYAFRLCTARWPDEAERGRLVRLYEDELARYRGDEAAAKKMAGEGPAPEGASEAEVAAYAVVGNVVLNLDETVTKE